MSDRLYIGRVVDPETLKPTDEAQLLKPDRLTRHAVCLGMTGSGKTGLCVTLLEELAIAGVPVIVIDPKGDMANLALAFSECSGADLEPWVDGSEASRRGITTAALAAETSAMWRAGLAEWGVDAARVRAFTEGAEVTILTPGSSAGVPVDVLSALSRPDDALVADEEALRDLVMGTVSAILGLAGIEADPIGDPEHIVLSTLLTNAWTAGKDLDLEGLILSLVDPPFAKVGVFPVDTFFPRRDRMKLAMQLNGIVASPAFAAWSEGVPLDIDALLSPVEGRTPIRVFYTAHLDDNQRMFFISTLLSRVVAWSRRQPGTSSLRALMYFDEVFGFLPPHPKNPPTKRPVLTLMKQARAVGVGTMLVTQNPVDVDYKALSNAGTWFIGRLQTAQDRERVLDGLASASGDLDRATVSGWLENLPSRTFVYRDIKSPSPSLLHSRWAISYLRGPLTRSEVARLDQPAWEPAPGAPVGSPSPAAGPTLTPAVAVAPTATVAPDDGLSAQPPPCPRGYTFRWLDPRVVFSSRLRDHFDVGSEPRRSDGDMVWRPAVCATLHLRFDEGRDFVTESEEQRLFFPLDGAGPPDAVEPGLEPSDWLPGQPAGGRYAGLPAWLDEKSELDQMAKRVMEQVYRDESVTMYRQRALRMTSLAGEDEARFRARVAAAIQDRVDAKVAKLKASVDRKGQQLDRRRRRLENDRDRLHAASRAQTATEVVSAAETIFGLFFGGRRRSLSSVASKRQQSMRAKERLTKAEQALVELDRQVYELEVDTASQITALENDEASAADDVQAVEVRLERSDVRLDDFHILWVPVSRPV